MTQASALDYEFQNPSLSPVLSEFPAELKQQVNSFSDTEDYRLGLKKAINKLPRGLHDELYYLLSLSQYKSGQYEKAKKSINESLAARAANVQGLILATEILIKLKRCNQALPIIEEASWRAKTENYIIYHLQGRCELEANKIHEAVKSLQRARELNPTYEANLRELINARSQLVANTTDNTSREQGKHLLMQDLEHLLQVSPDDRRANLRLATFLYEKSDPLFDRDQLERARRISLKLTEQAEYKDTEAIALLTRINLKQNNLSQAEKVLAQGIAKNPKSDLLQQTKTQLAIVKHVDQTKLEVESGIQ